MLIWNKYNTGLRDVKVDNSVAFGIDIHMDVEVAMTHFYHLALNTVCCLACAVQVQDEY